MAFEEDCSINRRSIVRQFARAFAEHSHDRDIWQLNKRYYMIVYIDSNTYFTEERFALLYLLSKYRPKYLLKSKMISQINVNLNVNVSMMIDVHD